ncbi:MAG TPA: hypothetical protein VF753_01715 [Terriglobales bacterium]
MANEKGLYWMALGVVALALVNGPVARQKWSSAFDGIADRVVALADQTSAHAAAYLNLAEMRLSGQPQHCVRTQVMFARVQARLANAEVAMAQHQAACARIEAERARVEAMRQMHSF